MSRIRVVLVGGADMLQDVIRQVVADDPALVLVGEAVTVEDLPALWKRTRVAYRVTDWQRAQCLSKTCPVIQDLAHSPGRPRCAFSGTPTEGTPLWTWYS